MPGDAAKWIFSRNIPTGTGGDDKTIRGIGHRGAVLFEPVRHSNRYGARPRSRSPNNGPTLRILFQKRAAAWRSTLLF